MSTDKTIPCIFIPGFGQSKAVLCDENGNTVRKVWPLSVDTGKIVKRITPPYIKTVIARKDKGFTDEAHDIFCEVLEPFAYNESGEAKYNIKAVVYDCPVSECPESVNGFVKKIAPVGELIKSIGEENLYCFSYNAFDNPTDTARLLDEYIQAVKKEKNTDSVNLLCFSMGASIAISYFAMYAKKKDIHRAVFIAGCLHGSAIQKAIATRDVDKAQGYSLLSFATNKETENTFRKVLALTTWETRYKLLFRSLDAVDEAILNNCPGMWAMLPPEISREQEKKQLSDEKFDGLRKKVIEFREMYDRPEEVFGKAKENGTEFFLFAGYGKRIMALCADDKLNTDGILDIASSTLGATSADRGEKLDKGERLSPDGQIDASTGLFCDTTWYFAGETHATITKNARVNTLVNKILAEESIDSVFSDSAYPQFN